jgi:hypothetical protein
MRARDRDFLDRADVVIARRRQERALEADGPVVKVPKHVGKRFEVSPPKPPRPNLPPGLSPEDKERLHLEEVRAKDREFLDRAAEVIARRRRERELESKQAAGL